MKIRIEVVNENEKIPETDRQSAMIELHNRKGDVFNVLRTTDIIEGSESQTFDIPVGGRLVITTPNVEREIVMDTDQNAAVKKAAQTNNNDVADAPKTDANEAPKAPPPSQTQNPQPRVQTQQAAPAPGATLTSPPSAGAQGGPLGPKTSEIGAGTIDTRNVGNNKK